MCKSTVVSLSRRILLHKGVLYRRQGFFHCVGNIDSVCKQSAGEWNATGWRKLCNTKLNNLFKLSYFWGLDGRKCRTPVADDAWTQNFIWKALGEEKSRGLSVSTTAENGLCCSDCVKIRTGFIGLWTRYKSRNVVNHGVSWIQDQRSLYKPFREECESWSYLVWVYPLLKMLRCNHPLSNVMMENKYLLSARDYVTLLLSFQWKHRTTLPARFYCPLKSAYFGRSSIVGLISFLPLIHSD